LFEDVAKPRERTRETRRDETRAKTAFVVVAKIEDERICHLS
jgi:hypothetical protein